MIDRLAQLRSLMKQPAAQEHIAATAGLAAREADQKKSKRKEELADLLWGFVRRTGMRAMKLRAQAERLPQRVP